MPSVSPLLQRQQLFQARRVCLLESHVKHGGNEVSVELLHRRTSTTTNTSFTVRGKTEEDHTYCKTRCNGRTTTHKAQSPKRKVQGASHLLPAYAPDTGVLEPHRSITSITHHSTQDRYLGSTICHTNVMPESAAAAAAVIPGLWVFPIVW